MFEKKTHFLFCLRRLQNIFNIKSAYKQDEKLAGKNQCQFIDRIHQQPLFCYYFLRHNYCSKPFLSHHVHSLF